LYKPFYVKIDTGLYMIFNIWYF